MKKVSIIMPTYNGSRWIGESIKSVQDQSYKDWELLIVDDGSTDDTASIIGEILKDDHRVRYIKNDQNMGIQRSLNRGIRESMGEYISRIDDDDVWVDKEKLEKQIVFLEENPDYVLVGTGVVIMNESGSEMFRYLLPETDEKIKNRILGKNCFVHSSVVFRKDVVLSVGMYGEGEEAMHFEDYDLWLRMGSMGKFANLPIYGVMYRMHPNSVSAKNKKYVFIKLINHIRKYKTQYKNYYFYIVFAYLRYFLYSIYLVLHKVIPINFFLRIYKKF